MKTCLINTLLAFAGAAVAGCAGMPGETERTAKHVRAECDKLYADARIDPLRRHIQLPISFEAPQPIEMLADKTRPTEAEKPAIKALSEAMHECRRVSEEHLGPLPIYRMKSEDRVLEALADLYEGATTYGQFAREVLYIGERDKVARETLDEEIRGREKWRALHDNGG
jgi:hypothetical protein